MAMNLNAALKIRADVDGQNKIVALNRGLNSLETTAKGVTGAMRGLTGASAGLSGALGTLAPLLSVAGLASMVKGTLDAADRMNDLAQSTGVSVEALSRFNKAAAVSGTDLEGVSKGLVKLNKAMVDAATGGKESAATFAALGVNVRNTDGSLKSADRVMLEVANRFKAMPDGAAKTALALRLFGKSGAELVPLLNMGGDAIDKMSTKMTTAFAKKADEYNDKLAMLGGKVRALGMDLTIALLPALDQITNALTVAVSAFNQMPDPLKATAVGAATLALAWGPLTGLVGGASKAFLVVKGAIEAMRLQMALAAMEGIPALSAAIMSIPGWGWALAGVAALGLLTKALYDNNDTFRTWVDNIGTVVANDFSAAMKNLADETKKGIATASSYFQDLAKAAKEKASYISSVFKVTSQDVGNSGKKTSDMWGNAFKSIGDNARGMYQAIGIAIQKLWAMIPAPLRNILGGSFKQTSASGILQLGQYAQSASQRAVAMGNKPAPSQASTSKSGANGGLSGFTPDLSALGGSSGADKAKAAADKAKQMREALAASRSALEQSKAELAIERELDPVRKIQLEYAEKRRAVMDAASKEMSRALSVEQRANIESTRTNDLDKLKVQEKKDLAEAYKKLGDEAYEAALKQQTWSSAAETTKNVLAGFRDGIGSYLESIGTLREGISSLTQNAFKGLEDAIVSLTTTGKFSFREFALSIVQEVTRMVTRLLILAPILQFIQSLMPGGGIGANFPSGAGLLKVKLPGLAIGANGMVIGQNGLQKFAMGGIVNRPTLFPFANGTGLMGEAGPEAIMPLKRGADGKLGVAGGGGTNITVNVDAKGTSVQGDDGRGGQLARVVAQAVQAELIRQKRPGGLMAA